MDDDSGLKSVVAKNDIGGRSERGESYIYETAKEVAAMLVESAIHEACVNTPVLSEADLRQTRTRSISDVCNINPVQRTSKSADPLDQNTQQSKMNQPGSENKQAIATLETGVDTSVAEMNAKLACDNLEGRKNEKEQIIKPEKRPFIEPESVNERQLSALGEEKPIKFKSIKPRKEQKHAAQRIESGDSCPKLPAVSSGSKEAALDFPKRRQGMASTLRTVLNVLNDMSISNEKSRMELRSINAVTKDNPDSKNARSAASHALDVVRSVSKPQQSASPNTKHEEQRNSSDTLSKEKSQVETLKARIAELENELSREMMRYEALERRVLVYEQSEGRPESPTLFSTLVSIFWK